MTLYTRHQVAVLLLVLAGGGLGLAVGHLRRTHPELIERLEGLDRSATPAPAPSPPDASPAPPARRPEPAPPPSPTPRAPAKSPTLEPGRDDSVPVDLNRATAADLARLPGIGPLLAARIVAWREARGPFQSVDDLRRVRGLGRVKLERLQSRVVSALP